MSKTNQIRKNLLLDESTIRMIENAGFGNFTVGVKVICKFYQDHQKKPNANTNH